MSVSLLVAARLAPGPGCRLGNRRGRSSGRRGRGTLRNRSRHDREARAGESGGGAGGGTAAGGGDLGACGAQPLRGAEGAGCLSCALLGVAQAGDCLGERGQPGDQHQWPERRISSDERERRQQPCGPAQAVPGQCRRRDPAVGCPRGTVVGISGVPENPAAQRGGSGMQGIGGGPGSIGAVIRAGPPIAREGALRRRRPRPGHDPRPCSARRP